VLAGGTGTRLWPLSTPENPKQFVLKAPSGFSLFQATLLRTQNRTLFEAPLVVTHLSLEEIAQKELHAIGCTDYEMILEPYARNTAPAIALAARHFAVRDPNTLMLVLPSDHYIEEPEKLSEALPSAMVAANKGYIVTFAVTPTGPETGYGYIEKGNALEDIASVHRIARFIEKPDAIRAASFIQQGCYGWNSGMFLMRAHVVLEEMTLHAPEVMSACERAYANAQAKGGAIIPESQAMLDCPSIAFDRAVMEHTTHGAVIDVAMGWRDLGSWEALAAYAPHINHTAENE